MAIDQRRYVDITSGVIGGTAVPLQKLDLRVFTDNDRLPTNQILEFTNDKDVADFFGENSTESRIAAAYFSYVSPAPVSRPRGIQFASHITSGRQPSVRSRSNGGTIEEINALGESEVSITINGETKTEEIDFSGLTSFADVASALSAAFSGLNFSYEVAEGDGYFIATMGFGVQVSFNQGDFNDLVGFTGAQQDMGLMSETMVEAFNRSIDANDSFGSAYFITQSGIGEIIAVAEAVAAKNVKYQLYVDVAPEQAEEYSAALIGTASTGLILRRPNDNRTLAWLPAAIMSATDYSRTNATTNYMYRQSGVTVEPQVTSTDDANIYDPLRINYYGQTAVSGSNISFFQRALLCGTANNPIDMSVHANEQWFKAYIAQQWFSLLLSTRGIPANRDGRARMMAVIAGAINAAINNGTILPGKTLTDVQKLAITDASGDDMAWFDVQDKGYWYNVEIVEDTQAPSGVTEHKANYVVIYAKGDWIRKVDGSHNLV